MQPKFSLIFGSLGTSQTIFLPAFGAWFRADALAFPTVLFSGTYIGSVDNARSF